MRARVSFSFVLAAVLAGSTGHAADAPKQPDAAQTAEAKKAFSAGVNLLQDPDGAKYEEAMLQFRRVYQLIATWKVLGNVGLCAMKLERDGEAIEAYEKYLKEGGAQIDPDEKAQVERDLGTLKASLVTVHLVFPSGQGKLIDERVNSRGNRTINEYPIVATTLDIGMHPGHHTLTARLAAGESRWEDDFAPGSKGEHKFTIAPPKGGDQVPPGGETQAGGRPIPTTVWVAGGATVALAVGATVTGLMANSKRSSFNEINGQPGKQEEAQTLHDSAKSMGLINTVLTGVAIAGAGATAYLFLTRPEASSTRTGKTFIAPWMTASGAGLFLKSDL
jgi:hypothetical protein